MFKRLSKQINSITVAASLIAASSVISRLIGIIRDRILAGEFGAGDTLDAYYAAFRAPDLIFNLLVLGALSAGFIPLFSDLIKNRSKPQDNQKAWYFAANVFNFLALSLILVSLLAEFFAPQLVKIIAPGFSAHKQQLTIVLTRIMFLSPVLLGLSSVFGGILQSFKRFLIYSFSPILYNLGIVVGALYFAPRWGAPGLAWGVVLGAALHFSIQMAASLKLGFKWRFVFDWQSKEIKKLLQMMVPRTLSLAIAQINLIVITIIASTLTSGALAVFNFANNIQSFPVGAFGISFALAAFPALAAAKRNKERIRHFSFVMRQILFFVLPSSVFLLTLRAQIVRIILGTGQFSWHDTVRTMDALGFFTIGLFAQATIPLLARMFYALKDSKTPFLVGLAAVGVGIVLSLWLPKVVFCNQVIGESGLIVKQCTPLGVSGLALAFSLANIVNFVLLWLALRVRLGDLDEIKIIKATFKFSLASIAAGLAVQATKLLLGNFVDMRRLWGVLVQGTGAALAGVLVYLLFCALLRSEEFFIFWRSFKRRLPWQKVETGDQTEAKGI